MNTAKKIQSQNPKNELLASAILSKNIKNGFKSLNRIGFTAKTMAVTGIRVANGEAVTPTLVRETFERLGTTYIKLGQFIASSPSLFPAEYVQEFQQCLDKTPALDFNYVIDILKQELGDDYDGYFKSINPTPLASASIAQVHAATLQSGEQVVLKIQKPDVSTIIHTDLSVVLNGMKLAEKFVPKLKFASLSQIVEEIKLRMVEEVDFLKEAQNIKDFCQFLQLTNNKQVTAPKVYQELSTKKVLVMERFFGVAMTNPIEMQQYCDNPRDVLTLTLNTWFASVMMCASFHADLHAGNLMLLNDGRVGFIDFGIVGKLNPTSWQAAMGFMHALQNNQYVAMAEHMVNMGMTHEKVNHQVLANDLQTMVEQLTGEQALPTPEKLKTDADELNQFMLEMVKVGERHGIHFPRDFTLLLKQMLYFDRFMQIIAPDIDLFDNNNIHLFG